MATKVSLIVTDLDGTLWEHESTIAARTLAALAQLATADVAVLVATGRRVRSTRTPLAAFGWTPPAVVLNGSLGLDLGSGHRFHRGGFSRTDAEAVLECFFAHSIHPVVYVDHEDRPVWVTTTPSTHPDHLADFGNDVGVGELDRIIETEHVLAFSVLGLPQDIAEKLGRELAPIASPHVDRDRNYGGYSVTVAPSAQSKWDGVLAFCSSRGLDPNAVLAIGDGPNDVDLLANAAVAVVPDDAHPAARAHAQHIVGCAADGGWADILDLLDLVGRHR
jgi:hydroxymethylpyrimidine pyrophosphatase-like HAD family hydrolase